MIIFLVEKVNVNCNTYKNGWIYLLVIITIICYLNFTEPNEIIVDKYCATSRQGIFAAGDVTDVPYKQAVISAGQGSIAALSAYNFIQKLKGGKSPPIKADLKSSTSSNR